jgi:PAS domain S-box-containing protein
MGWINNPISFFIADGKRILHGNREAKNLFGLNEETIISCTFKSYLEEKAQKDWDNISNCGHGHLFIASKTLQFNILDFGDSSLYIIDNEPDDPCVLRLLGRVFKSDTANTMPTFILDSNRKIVDCNTNFQEFVGTNQIKGLDCAKVIGCSIEEGETCPVKNSLIYNRPCSLKLFSRVAQRYILSTIIPFKTRDNSIYFLGLISDANLQLEMLYNETVKEYKKTKDILGLHPDLIFIQDENGFYQDLYANNENLLYVKKEEVIGKKISDLLPKDLADALQEQITKTINDGKLYTYEYWLDVPAGKQAFEARIIKYDQNKVLSFIRNITEQKLLQKKIEDIEKKFSFAFSKNPVPMAIFRASDGILFGGSQGLFDLFKYNKDEIIGKSSIDIGIFESSEERDRFVDNFTDQTDFSFEIEVKDGEGVNHLLSVYSRRMNIDSEDFLVVVAIDITELRKTQKELEESNQFNKWLLENIPNVVLLMSKDGIKYLHPNVEKMLGFTLDELAIMKFEKVFLQEDLPLVNDFKYRLLNDTDFGTKKFPIRLVHKDGNIKYVEAIATSSNIKDEKVGIISLLDITEVTKLGEKLSQNNEFLKSMLNSMRDSVFSIDKNYNYLYVHIPELENQGIDTSWLIGKPFGYNTEDDDPKEVEKIRNAIIKSIEEKCSVSFPVRMKMFGKERMYEVVATPLKNSFGESIGSVLVSKDITEQLQAEKQAQTEKKRFELIASNIKDVLFEAKDGILTYISAGVFLTLGRNVEDFVGCPVTNFVSKFKLAKIVKLRSNDKFTIVIDDNYGRLRDIEIQFTKIDDTYFGIARDVTDERSMEEAKRIFLGSVVHELKNPLTIMLGYNDILLDKFRNDCETYEILQIIKDSAKREENQINQLLKYNIAKHQYQFVKADAKGIFYNIVVRTKMLLQRLSVEKYGEDLVTFNHNLSSTLESISINVDFQAFSEIFENLAVNAFKYSPKESISISLDVCTSEGMVKAIIRDQGFGMSKIIQREVFKPFYQFDHKNAEKSGSGIGLSTVKLHVESHGGSITLDSQEGIGTTFELSFPISG